MMDKVMGTNNEDNQNNQDIKQNFKDTIIVVFTVFNISPKINSINPTPPVTKSTKTKSTKANKAKLTNQKNSIYYEENTIYIDLSNLKKAHTDYVDSILENKSEDQEGKFIKQLDKLKIFINNSPHKSVTSVLKNLINDQIDDSPYRIINNNLNSIDTLDTQMKIIYDTIDEHNASTPLGTLIFTDNISKFGTFDSVCSLDEKPKGYEHVFPDKKSSSGTTISVYVQPASTP
jgi:hypothetical protein